MEIKNETALQLYSLNKNINYNINHNKKNYKNKIFN